MEEKNNSLPLHLNKILKTENIKNKKKAQKAAREKPHITDKEKPIRIIAEFSMQTLKDRKG